MRLVLLALVVAASGCVSTVEASANRAAATTVPLTAPLVLPTPTPLPVPTPVVTPEPTVTPVPWREFPPNPRCPDMTPPSWVTAPDRILVSGERLGNVQGYIWQAFQSAACQGSLYVRISQCEGLNPAGRWDPAAINFADHVGWFQVSWVHGEADGIIAGRWPEGAATTIGNVAAALELRRLNRGDAAWRPWSGHCYLQ